MSVPLTTARAAGAPPDSPQVSVLLPARDAGRWLRHTLGDLLRQRNVTLEVLAVDDHSTDRTGAIVENNNRKWSGDHCMDKQFLSGVLACNRTIASGAPALYDLTPSVLEFFGLPAPGEMIGRNVIA